MDTNAPKTTGPTEIDFFAGHASRTLRLIAAEKTAASAWTAERFGADHPMALEALRIANAAWGQLVLRGEEPDMGGMVTCEACDTEIPRTEAIFTPEPDGGVLDVLCARCAALPRIRIATRRNEETR
jgi:hypothetical protein